MRPDAISRRQFNTGLFVKLPLALLGVNYLTPSVFKLATQVLTPQEYDPSTIQAFERAAEDVHISLKRTSRALGVLPPEADFDVNVINDTRRPDAIIDELNPNSIMIFIPGALAHELYPTWANNLTPWIAAFEERRTGATKEQAGKGAADFIGRLHIGELLNASREARYYDNFTHMMAGRTIILPWEYVAGPRNIDGTVSPERPGQMAVYMAGYMKWVLDYNHSAEFTLWGHSLGANATHYLLRLMQGGIYKDLKDHIPNAILHSQPFDDMTNAALYSFVRLIGAEETTIEEIKKLNRSLSPKELEYIQLMVYAACPPAFFSGLNPKIVKRLTSIYSAHDIGSSPLPQSNGVRLSFSEEQNNTFSCVAEREVAPDNYSLFRMPENLPLIIKMLKEKSDQAHEPNQHAIEPIFGTV